LELANIQAYNNFELPQQAYNDFELTDFEMTLQQPSNGVELTNALQQIHNETMLNTLQQSSNEMMLNTLQQPSNGVALQQIHNETMLNTFQQSSNEMMLNTLQQPSNGVALQQTHNEKILNILQQPSNGGELTNTFQQTHHDLDLTLNALKQQTCNDFDNLQRIYDYDLNLSQQVLNSIFFGQSFPEQGDYSSGCSYKNST
jgi:hypothetical protein